MNTRRAVCAVVVLALASVGCDYLRTDRSEGERRERPAPILETAEQAVRRMHREECARMQTNPSALLETSEMQFYDKGIINDYRQLTAVTVLNRSRYCAMRSARGDVIWYDALGNKLGSSPITLSRSIPAGGTGTFSTADGTLTSGTIQGAGAKAQILLTQVDVVMPP